MVQPNKLGSELHKKINLIPQYINYFIFCESNGIFLRAVGKPVVPKLLQVFHRAL